MAGCLGGNPRARLALLVCNIVLVVAGVGCLAGGIVLVLGRKAYGDSLQWLEDLVVEEADIVGYPDLDASALDVKFVTRPVGIAFLVTGSFVIILAILGIVASTRPFKKLLLIYVGITSAVMFAFVVTVVCAYSKPSTFQKHVKKVLKESLNEYTGISGNDSTTLGWNAIMIHLDCCGIDDYEDFEVANDWLMEIDNITLVTPIACCEEVKSPPKCAKKSKFEKKTFYDRGCYDALFHYVTAETGLMLFVIYFILFMEFLCLFFSVLITCVEVSKSPDKVRVMDFMY